MEGKKVIILSLLICLIIGVLYFVYKPHDSDAEAIFGDLVGIMNHANEVSNQDIHEILDGKVDDETIYGVYVYLSEKTNYGEDLSQCNEVEKNFLLLYDFDEEVANGGVEQFIANCYENKEETLKTLEKLKLENSYQYLKSALELYPKNYIEYNEDKILSEKLSKLDEQYYNLHEKEFYDFVYSYLEEHKNDFY
ncbi:MAG: DUF4375 domain-containing protein [Longibaculum sp.]